MKVCDLPYKRVTLEEVEAVMKDVIARIRSAKSADEILVAREDCNALRLEYQTAASLSYMRYSINTVDEFYVAEKEYYDEVGPSAQNYMIEYASALLDSPFRAELEKALSPVLFKSLEVERKSMSPEIIEDMVEENKLVSEYSQLMAGMEFEFRGEKMPRTLLAKYYKDDDRNTRREAYEALGKGLAEHAEALDSIYDKLVHVRDRMAKKMGYKNFVELGYYRMGRLCYDQNSVKTFRENVLRDVVPVVARMRTENAKRMGIEKYMFYDDGVIVPGGDPKPCGKEGIFAAAREMYHSMGKDPGNFIDMMIDNEAFDVDSRKNKWGGGYCTEFPKFKQPFILANFNGTAGDVDVMTHEAGHALNAYLIADNRFALELGCGGMETAETHSMSMEFFCWPHMEKFFGENAGKYRFMHALDSLSFIPYGTMVDAFQHIVYENPDMTPAERNAAWLELEGKFRPHISFEGMPYLEKGTRWQYQMHIYESPFYYIDYCLAQTAAFNFLLASQENYDDAFARYMRLSRQGGEKVWTDLLDEAGFVPPFVPGALATLATKVEALIDKIRV
ncbi:MAG: M3 family oligoendopeptidase [Clostridiales bacterium]|nr:M3 family oligoendopeptidase [Clostridiales bacterium]MDY2834723.1 M3 family oligoendopeptidase [Candidatus Aphodomonas sp.]